MLVRPKQKLSGITKQRANSCAPISRLGGKSKLALSICAELNRIPHQRYVEPFCGGARVFFHKEPSKVEVLNDLDGDIANLFRMLRHHEPEFRRLLSWEHIGRECFQRWDSPQTLFYIDPPYYGCEDDYGKGMYSPEQHELLAETLRQSLRSLPTLHERPPGGA